MFIKIKPVIKSLVPVIVAAFAVGAIVFAWTEPSQTPPSGNVDAPLNVGDTGQSKKGNLALNTDGVLTYGLLVPFGNVGIGTIDPTQQLHIANSNSDAAVLFEQKGLGSTETFNYTGSQKTWVVPAGVTSISVDAQGSAGGAGSGNGGGAGGRGARVQTTLAVTPYETLYIYVGGLGYNGGGAGGTDQDENPLNGGAGGGGSDIRQGGINNRVIVAGGGGGGGGGWGGPPAQNGGGGGWSSNIGSPGLNGQGTSNICTTAAVGGEGASQAAVGIGGPKSSGNNGDAGGGGGGGYRGGGGGGGYSSYGGNGSSNGQGGSGGNGNDGVACAGAGGGGGSSYANPSKTSNTVYTNGYSTGNGKIIISYSVSTWLWTMGVDKSDNNGKFKISNSNALGTSDKLIMDAAGNINVSGDANAARLCIAGDCKNTWQQASVPVSTGLYGWCGGMIGGQSAMPPALAGCNQSRTYCSCNNACSAGYTSVQLGQYGNNFSWYSCYKN